jgi:hypothetical protein
MDGLLQPNINPTTERQESSLRPILIGIVIVGIVVGILALILRHEQKKAAAQITFKDELGQTAQREELPIRVLRTGGPYDEAVDLNLSPLAPGQSKPFRLTFENISAQWNHAYPDLQITQVSTR